MCTQKSTLNPLRSLRNLFFAVLFSLSFTLPIFTTPAFAEPITTPTNPINPINPTNPISPTTPTNPISPENPTAPNTPNTPNTPENTPEETPKTCYDQFVGLGWLICAAVDNLGKGIDALYNAITDLLIIKPITFDSTSQIAIIWRYFRDLTNIVFIILIIIAIYSQITGLGFSNYNIKRILPRIIIAAILINLSFFVCSVAVDISNILGSGLYNFLRTVETSSISPGSNISWTEVAATLIAGTGVVAGISIAATSAAGGINAVLWLFIPTIFGAFISVVIGFFTIAARQAIVALLIMISPLAFVAYLLPNTEKHFRKWKDIFTQMLIFYPTFSLLFGASSLAGTAIITSSGNLYGFILGMAIKIFPLFFSVTLMKMSGTVLGRLNNLLNNNPITSGAKKSINDLSSHKVRMARANYAKKGFETAKYGRRNNGAVFYKNNLIKKQRQADDLAIAEEEVKLLQGEHFDARRVGKEIIGYRDGQAIYTQAPLLKKGSSLYKIDKDGNVVIGDKRTATHEMERDYRAKVLRNRAEALHQEVHKELDAMGDFLEHNNFDPKDARVKNLTNLKNQNLEHFLTIDSHKKSMAQNDAADARYLHDRTVKASLRDKKGNIVNEAEYQKMIVRASGYDGLSDDQKIKNAALAKVTAKSYDAFEAERKKTIDNYSSYAKNQLSSVISLDYKKFIEAQDAEGMTAMIQEMTNRGDVDKITEPLIEAFQANPNFIELGTDFSSTIARTLMKDVKGKDPFLSKFAKHILVETQRYVENQRTDKYVSLEEYLLGVDSNDDKTKFDIISCIKGASFDDIERTAYAGLSSLFGKYLNKDEHKGRRMEIFNSALPSIISSMPKYASGGEQIINTMQFITGGIKKTVEENGQMVSKFVPDSSRSEFMSQAEFTKMTKKYLSSLTADNIINMKSDSIKAVLDKLEYDIISRPENQNLSSKEIEKAIRKEYVSSFNQDILRVLANSPDISRIKGTNLKYLEEEIKKLRQVQDKNTQTQSKNTQIQDKDSQVQDKEALDSNF